MADAFVPTPRDRFTFGLWTVGNPGRDPFGEPTRAALSPAEVVELLAKAGGDSHGVWGVNFHDNDLIPIGATPAEADALKGSFAAALKKAKMRVAMVTANLFSDPAFKDGAFTSNDAEVRAFAVQKCMRAMDLGAEFGAKMFVFWGGREGVETEGAKDPIEAEQRFRRAVDFLCDYSIHRRYEYRFALEAKPNEPRGHMYFATTGHYLALIPSLKHPDLVGVNPEVAHEHMAGLNFTHAVAQALAAGKLFHIDLNDQQFGRFDQDFRFGSVDPKAAFFLVKLLEEQGYDGFRHFDAHAYRTADRDDVIEFARGCMRTYLILKDKAKRWAADSTIKSLLKQINSPSKDLDRLCETFTKSHAETLLAMAFDRAALAARPLPYERLDQRTMEILLGVD